MNAIQPINLLEYQLSLREENKRHEEAIKLLKARLCQFQKTCKHKHTWYQGDPSGGHDSCTTCTDCDKVL